MKKWAIFIRVNGFTESCRLIEGRYLVGDTASKRGSRDVVSQFRVNLLIG